MPPCHWARPEIHNPPFKILDLPLCSRNYSHNDKFTLIGSKVFKLGTSLTLQIDTGLIYQRTLWLY